MMPNTKAGFSLLEKADTEVGAALVFWVLFQTLPIFIPIKPPRLHAPSCAFGNNVLS